MADYCGVRNAIGVANGTDALLLTLDALGVGEGDEVITSPFTFFASAEVISQVGATPVFVDIDPETFNLDTTKLEDVITQKTKAIIPVHIFGQPVDMDSLLKIADKYNLYVIEDACQAIGSKYNGKKIGSIGKAGCFSFFPTKNLGGYGDGGIVVTDDDELAKRIRILRVHGSCPKYYHSMIGYNSRLDAIQAAVLSVKLKYIDEWNQQRVVRAKNYDQLLESTPLALPSCKDGRTHVFHLYVVQTEYRDELMAYLKSKGISTGVYYPVPLHLQEVYKDLGYAKGALPTSEKMALRTFALPLYPELTFEQQEYIAEQVKKFYREKGLENE
jgi:dTDP-4-amino-4,6-dideoxygalactose transaminase